MTLASDAEALLLVDEEVVWLLGLTTEQFETEVKNSLQRILEISRYRSYIELDEAGRFSAI
ncbi:hypothetical protein [Pseudomonas sp. O39]|uniref:hypothetical protein n=1 Tax=Pseudomonas sp. O39 TaxID=3379130 RepID=UPI00387ADA7B